MWVRRQVSETQAREEVTNKVPSVCGSRKVVLRRYHESERASERASERERERGREGRRVI